LAITILTMAVAVGLAAQPYRTSRQGFCRAQAGRRRHLYSL